MKNVLVLFPNEWDRLEFSGERFLRSHRFFYEGFDLFKFPQNARLLSFDVQRFIDRIVAKYASTRLDAVFSSDEQIGSMVAAVVAQRLGLPHTRIEAVLTAQHKFYSRRLQQRIAPEATPKHFAFPYTVRSPAELGLEFPFFVKPVKATYSILAREVRDWSDLAALLKFAPLEHFILQRLVKPFNDLASDYAHFAVDAHHLVGEEMLSGSQVTLDGYVNQGNMTVLGIVDSIMYPGTNAFERFEYPSRLPPAVQQRMQELAQRLVAELGFNHGAFNIEFFYRPQSDSIHFIEINPRIAYQFADLYEKVDGFNLYDVVLALSLGETPRHERGRGAYKHAASFVLRDFAGRALKRHPSARAVRELQARHRDARVVIYVKHGASLAREMKWLGSYRYAILNLGAMSSEDLYSRYRHLRDQLGLELS